MRWTFVGPCELLWGGSLHNLDVLCDCIVWFALLFATSCRVAPYLPVFCLTLVVN
jgi:hypothetical protein